MEMPVNLFKRALREGRQQIGLWNSLPGAYVAEALAGCGYDWMLLDTEHSPSDVIDVLGKLQAVAPYPVQPMVRAAWNDVVLIKRLLDVGALSLLIPYVQSVEEAEAAVAAARYAPAGMRGVAGGTRATRFGRVPGYWQRASEEICLIVQIETVKGMEALEAIAAVDGIDGVFIGPADLGASLGYPGELDHPEVVRAVEECIRRGALTGKAVGTLTGDPALARRCIELGSTFTAVGIDMALLLGAAERLVGTFR